MILKHPILFFTWHHIGMEIKQTSMRTHSAAVPQWMVFLPKNPSLCLKWVARDSKTPTLDFIPVFTPTSGIRSSLRPAGAVSIFNSIPKISFDARTQWPWYFVSVSAEHRPSIILDSGLSFTIITESPPCWAFLLFFSFFFYVSGRNQPCWSSLSSPPCNQHGGGQNRLLHCAGCHAGYGRVRRSGGYLQLCQDPLLQTYQHDPDWSEWERPQAFWPAECGSRSVAAALSLSLCVWPLSLVSSVAVYPLLMKKRDLTY